MQIRGKQLKASNTGLKSLDFVYRQQAVIKFLSKAKGKPEGKWLWSDEFVRKLPHVDEPKSRPEVDKQELEKWMNRKDTKEENRQNLASRQMWDTKEWGRKGKKWG